MHEIAHATDHKHSVVQGRPDTIQTISYIAVMDAVVTVPKQQAARHMNCLADLVDGSGDLKRLYLNGANLNTLGATAIPTEFLAFSFENTFVAPRQNPEQFRDRAVARLRGEGYSDQEMQWAQDTLNSLSTDFLHSIPPQIAQHVQPLYDELLNPGLIQRVQQQQYPQVQAPALAANPPNPAAPGPANVLPHVAPRLQQALENPNTPQAVQPKEVQQSRTPLSSPTNDPPSSGSERDPRATRPNTSPTFSPVGMVDSTSTTYGNSRATSPTPSRVSTPTQSHSNDALNRP
jgi:hypothetical protein